MWVRVDPEMQWIRHINMQQPDTTWMNTLNYNRDAVSQLEVYTYMYSTAKMLTVMCVLFAFHQ